MQGFLAIRRKGPVILPIKQAFRMRTPFAIGSFLPPLTLEYNDTGCQILVIGGSSYNHELTEIGYEKYGNAPSIAGVVFMFIRNQEIYGVYHPRC
jgi:hypothetical protein